MPLKKTILGEEKKRKTLKLLCETRWASRSNAINTVVANYEVILDALEEISEDTGKVGAEAHSLLMSCSTFGRLVHSAAYS